MAKQTANLGKNWYALHTYSGYEENVAQNLKQRIKSMGMGDRIFNILVPKERKVKIKDGKRYEVEERVFPGYVLVEMVVTDDSWYVVRNTPNVTGFIGSGNLPVPVSPEEIKNIAKKTEKKDVKYKVDLNPGDAVKITDGPFKEFDGKISELDEARGKIKVLVNMFGRETPVELDFLQVKKI